MYTQDDFKRLKSERNTASQFRSEFWRDYARVLHSPSFRRLVGKTQLFPGNESDFFRNRLTHSLEVAQIAKTIARKCNHDIKSLRPNYNELDLIDTDLIEIACHIHDIGHPPFGHQGEAELDRIMLDFGGFEGNAQSLRLVTKLEKKVYLGELIDRDLINNYGVKNESDQRLGLNLTLRAICSFLKYDNPIPNKVKQRIPQLIKEFKDEIELLKEINSDQKKQIIRLEEKKILVIQNDSEMTQKEIEISRIKLQLKIYQEDIQSNNKVIKKNKDNIKKLSFIRQSKKNKLDDQSYSFFHPVKGYYQEEKSIVEQVKKNYNFHKKGFKTIECKIMDLSDDIAYAIYDFEDSLKGDFIQPLDLITISSEILGNISHSVNKKFPELKFSKSDVQLKLYQLFSKVLNIKENLNSQSDSSDITRIVGELIAQVYLNSNRISNHGHIRTIISSRLVDYFIRDIKFEYDEINPMFSQIKLKEDTLILLEILKKVTFELQVHSIKLRIVESRGKEIVRTIFESIEKSNGDFLPRDYRAIYNSYPRGQKGDQQRKRTICDFVAGMTDKYAVEFYGRLKSEEPQTIFKRI